MNWSNAIDVTKSDYLYKIKSSCDIGIFEIYYGKHIPFQPLTYDLFFNGIFVDSKDTYQESMKVAESHVTQVHAFEFPESEFEEFCYYGDNRFIADM